MIRNIYKINNEGVYEDVYKANLKESTYYNGEKWVEIDFSYVEVQPPYAKISKWENGDWVIIEEHQVKKIEPQPLSETEQRILDLEMAMAAILGGGM